MSEQRNTLIQIGKYAAAITAVLTLYVMINSGVKDIVKASSETLALKINESARDLADIHKADLHVRIRTLSREIEEIDELSRPLPPEKLHKLQRLKSHRDDLQHQVDEVNEKWFKE